MAETFSLKPIMLFFVVLLLGLTFVTVIANQQVANTELSNFGNTSITLTGGSSAVSPSLTPLVGISFFGNATHNTVTNSFVLGQSLNFTRNGTIQANISGVYNISGSYEGALYVQDEKSRPILRLTVFLFILGLIGYGIYIFKEQSGDMNFGFK